MGIGGVTSGNSMSVMQMTSADLKDQKSKNIQNKITDARQKMQKLSSEEELSAGEKATEQKKLQKEISSLDIKLKQHQDALLRSQKREALLAELREEQGLTKEEKAQDNLRTEKSPSDQTEEKERSSDAQQTEAQGTVIARSSDGVVILKGAADQTETSGTDEEKNQAVEAEAEDVTEKASEPADGETAADAGFSHHEMRAMVSADASTRQADRLGTLVTKTSDGIAILKGEISQDERRGVNTERKEAELEETKKREIRATGFQFSVLNDADNALKAAAQTNTGGTEDDSQEVADNGAFRLSQEEQARQQFHVSIA